MKRRWRAPCFALAAVILLAACVPVPQLGTQLSEEEQATIVVGSTTRDQILELLGEPDIAVRDVAYLYDLWQSPPGLVILSHAGAGFLPFGKEAQQRHMFEFDEGGTVVSSQTYTEPGTQVPCDGVPLKTLARVWEKEESFWVLHDERERQFLDIAFSSRGDRLVAASREAGVFVWEMANGWRETVLPSGDGCEGSLDCAISSVAADGRNGTIAAAEIDDSVWIWRIGGNDPPVVLKSVGDGPVEVGGVTTLTLAPNGQVIAVGDQGGNIQFWNPATGELQSVIHGHGDAVTGLDFAPDGNTLISVSLDGSLKAWDTASGALLAREIRVEPLTAVAFAPDGTQIALSGRRHIEIWRVESGNRQPSFALLEPTRVLALPFADQYFFVGDAIAFNSDGSMLGTVAGTADIWAVPSGQHVRCLLPSQEDSGLYNASLSGIAFSPDDKMIATSGTDGVKLWALEPIR